MKNGKFSKLKRAIAAVMILVFATTLASCSTFDSFKHTFIDKDKEAKAKENTIYIGVYEPKTGEMSQNGKDQIKGIELANSIYDNVIGYDVELITVDTQSNTNTAKTAIKSLIEMKPVAIIGAAGEATSLIASKYISEANIPTITPSAVNPLITSTDGYYFRACITENQMGEGLADYAINYLKTKGIAVIDIKNDSTTSAVLDGFRSKIKSETGSTKKIISEDAVSVTETSWKKIIKKIKKSNADTVFIPFGVEESEAFFKEAEKVGLTDVTYIGKADWGTEKFAKMLKKHPKIKVAFPYSAVISDNNSSTDTVTAETQRFIIEYTNKYGIADKPTQDAALGYDSYLLIMNAIDNANSLKGKDIKDAMHNIKNLQCSTGVFNFDDKGNNIRRVNIATVKKGMIVSEYTAKDQSKAGELEEVKH